MKLKKSSGCVFDLRMSEGSGSTAYDSSRYGNDGALNGCKWIEHWLEFNGTSSYVGCGNDASLNITEAITISVWIYPTADKSYARIVDKSYLTGYSFWGHNLSTDKKLTFVSNDAGVNQSSNTVFGLNEWQHAVVTYDKANVKFYRNGVYAGGGAETASLGTSTSNLSIGAVHGSGNNFAGSIDDVRIHNRALNASEIKTYYDSTKYKYL